MIDDFLKSEISLNRLSGTYLFYGEDTEKNYKLAKEFAKELFTSDLSDFTQKENIKAKIDKESYSDLFIEDNLTIDNVREIIKKNYTSSYEGGKKVFIIKNIQNIRKESANALLKIIEEPTDKNFFILLSNRLNILPTIKSRSIIYRIKKSNPQDLGIDKYVYDFFMGFSADIIEFKNYKNINLDEEKNFSDISNILKIYQNEKSIENKINLYKCLRNFVSKSISLTTYEKIKFAEDLVSVIDKESIKIVVNYLLNLIKRDKNLKDKLYLKQMLRHPINIKLFFINLILEI